jgi:signal transduction histidine kinase
VVGSEKLLEGAEEERRRIAMDIHDQILADITGLMREARGLSDVTGLDETTRRRLRGLAQGLDELTGDMRRVIDDLHPQTLEILGLEAALRSYLEKRLGGEGQPAFYLAIDRAAERRLTPFARLGLYRILVEAVHNIVRHADASRYEIDGRRQEDALVLTVEDNGRGMDVEAVRGQGRGILNIERRARALGAAVSWGRSRFSQGVRLELRVPLNAATPATLTRQAHG